MPPPATRSARDLAALLRLVADPPNRREQPRPGDRAGTFDAWFDGGAIRFVTGSTEYHLADGTIVSEAVSPVLSLSIRYQDGEVVSIASRPAPDSRLRS